MKTVQQVADSLMTAPAVAAVRALLEQESARGFLVNSAVRDSFIGITPNLYHFVITDTDPLAFAHKLTKTTPGFVTERLSEPGTGGRYHGELGELHFIYSDSLNVPEYLERNSDFTVNSLAFDFAGQRIHALHGAMADLEHRLVRLVSNIDAIYQAPNILIKAVSLALLAPAFTLTPQTHAEIKARSDMLARAHHYALGYELMKILNAKEYQKGIRMLNDLALLPVLFRHFLPCALPARTTAERADAAYPLELSTQLAAAVDELLAAAEFLRKYVALLRQVLLLTPWLRARMAQMARTQVKPFLIAWGAQLEREVGQLVAPVVYGFRVRMICVGYLAGVAALAAHSAGASALEAAVERTIATFGVWKGGLSSVLLCADWAVTKGNGSARPEDLTQAADILRRQLARPAGGPVPPATAHD